ELPCVQLDLDLLRHHCRLAPPGAGSDGASYRAEMAAGADQQAGLDQAVDHPALARPLQALQRFPQPQACPRALQQVVVELAPPTIKMSQAVMPLPHGLWPVLPSGDSGV